MIKRIQNSDTLVFGCGNPLFGDDGFGPEVINYLDQNHSPPALTAWIDVGTSIRDILFDIILSEKKPKQIIIVDSIDSPGRESGEIFEIDIDEINPKKLSDYSLHQFPTTNMLKELKEETDIDIKLFVTQIDLIPDEVAPGISEKVMNAVPEICEKIMNTIN